MKSNQYVVRVIKCVFGISISITAISLAVPGFAQETIPKTPERIGVYDSRAVAVAYTGSIFQETKMKELKARYKKAREEGDATEVSRLEAKGQAWQKELTKQGFGTASVDELLNHISGQLPEIQKQAGVVILISKWNKAELEQHPKAEQVDVTMRLVDAFHPNETQRKHALEIQKVEPTKVKEGRERPAASNELEKAQ